MKHNLILGLAFVCSSALAGGVSMPAPHHAPKPLPKPIVLPAAPTATTAPVAPAPAPMPAPVAPAAAPAPAPTVLGTPLPRRLVYTPAGDLPFSESVQVGGNLYLSGKIGLDENGKLVEGVGEQTRQIFKNLEVSLKKRGYTLNDLVKCTVMLRDMKDFEAMNAVYREVVPQPYPARAAMAVNGLAMNADVEIECIAAQ